MASGVAPAVEWWYKNGSTVSSASPEARRLRDAGSNVEDRSVLDSIATSPPLITTGLPETAAEDFFSTLFSLASPGDTHRAVECIVDYLDDQLNAGEFAECNDVLRQVDVEKLSAPPVVAFLGITRTAKEFLPARAEFSGRARTKFTNEIGAERAEACAGVHIGTWIHPASNSPPPKCDWLPSPYATRCIPPPSR